MPGDFFSAAPGAVIASQLHSTNPWAVAVGLACLGLVVLWPKSYAMPMAGERPVGWLDHARRWAAHVPGTIVALVLATAGHTGC